MGQRLEQFLERAAILPGIRPEAERISLAQKAEGARVYDVDNHGYIDYTGAGGAAILGYANQFVLDAVRRTLATGIPDGFHTPQEIELAEALTRFLPWAGAFTFHRSEDEALSAVLKAAVRLTGRERVLFLRGRDDGSGATGCVRRGPEPPGSREVPGWDLDRIEAAIVGGASKLAAVVVDPILSACGVVPAPEGVLARVAAIATEQGVLFVLDERVTGFRLGRGGAAEWAGVEPDAAVYGGALGNGFPIGVVAYRHGIDPSGVPEDPTAVHPVSLAAAEAVLSVLKNDTVYERLGERTAQLAEGLLALAGRFGRPMTINRAGSILAIYATREPVTAPAGAAASDLREYRRLAEGLRGEGVLLPADGLRPMFLSHAHSQKDVEETLAACERVLLRLHQEDLP